MYKPRCRQHNPHGLGDAVELRAQRRPPCALPLLIKLNPVSGGRTLVLTRIFMVSSSAHAGASPSSRSFRRRSFFGMRVHGCRGKKRGVQGSNICAVAQHELSESVDKPVRRPPAVVLSGSTAAACSPPFSWSPGRRKAVSYSCARCYRRGGAGRPPPVLCSLSAWSPSNRCSSTRSCVQKSDCRRVVAGYPARSY